MEIKSISSLFTPYWNKIREVIYTTKVDGNNKQFVEQTVYYRPNDGVKGTNVDVKV